MRCQLWIPESVAEVQEFVDKTSGVEFGTPDTWLQLVLVSKATDEIIGDIGVHFPGNMPQQVDIGCTLSPKYQGLGYATEALIAVIDYLYGKMDNHRVFASTDPANQRAVALLERMGMRQEAHLRRSQLVRGAWTDDFIYAVLREEWLQR
jgi:RimJ/RimL family protein N-acetyltransferase